MTTFSGESYLRTLLDAFPSPVLVVDATLRIYDANRSALNLVGKDSETTLKRLCGDVLHCLHALNSEKGCGTTESCPDCVFRQTAEGVESRGETVRRMSEMLLQEDGKDRHAWFLVTGSPVSIEEHDFVVLTLEDVTELIELHSLVPICAHCHKVRDDANYWQHVEDYLHKYTAMRFSHGICPDCLKEHYPDLY